MKFQRLFDLCSLSIDTTDDISSSDDDDVDVDEKSEHEIRN